MRPTLFTRGLSSLSQTTDANSPGAVSSPAEQREDAKRAMFTKMRPLPTQHYWHVFTDLQSNKNDPAKRGAIAAAAAAAATAATTSDGGDQFLATLNQLSIKISSVQEFWFYQNNTPLNDLLKMRDSIYLFKAGFRPVWEDRRNINGGSWTFRMPKSLGFDFWAQVQLMAIGEQLQACLDDGDQICGVGLSVRFNSHLVTIWHRESSKQKSIDGILKCVLDEMPANLKPKGPDNYFYKKHSDHAGFKAPPGLQAVLDSQKARDDASAATAQNGQGQGQQSEQQPGAASSHVSEVADAPSIAPQPDAPKVPAPAIVEVPASDEK